MSAPAVPASAPSAAERLSAPQKALRQLGLTRDIDLALHLPLRYEDETRIARLADARPGETVQFEGTVTHQEVAVRGRRQLLVTVNDGSTACLLRFFHFYPTQLRQMAVGARLRVRGELRGGPGGLTMMHPVVRPAGGDLPRSLTPVYPAAAALPQAYLRKAVAAGLARADLSETIPPECLDSIPALRSCSLKDALSFLHHPAPGQSALALEDRSHPAWQRLKAEELLAQQLSQLAARRERARLQAPALAARPGGLPDQLLAALPFTLTGAQRRVTAEIARDLGTPRPMQRLLQGDVGAGKTVVAALAAALAIDAGWQCALMAPTEILAEQHFSKLAAWLEPLLAPLGKRVVWLTGSQKKSARAAQLAAIESGEAALAVGTHAVIGEQVRFARLGLAVIDEQHRFGVQQRLELRRKLSQQGTEQGAEQVHEPHFLMMSATPIPRTLAMSYYADLDVSTLDELPPGRTPVVTKLVHERRRAEVIAHVRGWADAGRQIYWVCPLIDTPEGETPGPAPRPATPAQELRAAIETQAELTAALPGREVGLIHSRLPAAEKKTVMARFTAGELPVLVATTVIEVGVDVPNASVMVIEHADRFGLAQLHQLRGRVGRGATASACVLLYGAEDGAPLGPAARERLRAMRETHDGFEIARRDLAIRGPGEFLGARQSGAALLRFASLTEGDPIFAWARRAAPVMLDRYPALARRHVQRWLGEKADYLKA